MQDKIKNLKIFKAEQEIKIKELYYKMNDSGFYSAETTNMLLNIIIENHGKKSAPVRSQGQNILEALKILKYKINEYRRLISSQLEALDDWSLDKSDNFRKMKESADVITHKISELEDNVVYLEDLEDK